MKSVRSDSVGYANAATKDAQLEVKRNRVETTNLNSA